MCQMVPWNTWTTPPLCSAKWNSAASGTINWLEERREESARRMERGVEPRQDARVKNCDEKWMSQKWPKCAFFRNSLPWASFGGALGAERDRQRPRLRQNADQNPGGQRRQLGRHLQDFGAGQVQVRARPPSDRRGTANVRGGWRVERRGARVCL